MSVVDQIEEVGRRMQEEQANLEEAILETCSINVSDEQLENGVNRLIYNHCINKSKLRDFFGGAKGTFNKRIDTVIAEGVISEPIFQNRSHLFTRHQVATLMEHWGSPSYRDNYQSQVISIQNHKGGTGKSTTTVALAVKTALDLDLNAKVCLIDLDPQGSAARGLIQPSDDEVYLTMADLLVADYEPDSDVSQYLEMGNSFEDVVLATPFSTHLPNLDVITAFPTDEKFTDYYWRMPDEEKGAFLARFKNEVLPILRQKYDLIYLDLPPQDSPITWSAAEATDCILVPITPRTYDFASTTNYMRTLPNRLRTLPSQGTNIKWMKMIAVNYNDKSKPERNTFDKLLRSVRSQFMTATIKHSDAFVAAADLNRSVLDIMKSEDICSDKQFDIAVNSVNAAYDQFIVEMKVVAAK